MALLLAAFAGCNSGGSGDDDGDDDDSSMIDGGATPQPDANPGSWEPLITGEWQLASGTEGYYCATKTLTEKIYIGGFRPIAPLGTHHTVVSYGPGDGSPDNPGYQCGPGTENPQWVYASGVGTGELLFPDGIGVVLEAGTQVHINLHLYNVTENTLTGPSGVEFIRLDQNDVVHEAELFLPGPVQFNVAQGMQTVSGTCSIGAQQTIFAIFPHMHQLGVHFKAEAIVNDVTMTIWDDAYDFETQEFVLLDQVTLSPGDKIRTTCTYNNTTGGNVSFGDSSDQEMCFTILLRYPRINAGGGLTGVLCPF